MKTDRQVEIDVAICTWNSNRGFFRKVLTSIRDNIPVHHLIVVDHASSDSTVAMIRQFFPTAIIEISTENLGRARKSAISLVDTPHFAFIDDDIEIPEGWFTQLQAQMRGQIGAIHNIPYPIHLPPVVRKWDEWSARSEKKGAKGNEIRIIDVTSWNQRRFRGFTNNTLIRTDLVVDWNPSENLISFEDRMIMRHIVEKGYTWRMILDRTVKHYRPRDMQEHLLKLQWNFVGARLTGYDSRSLRRRIAESLIAMYRAVIASVQLHDPQIMLYVFNLHWASVDCYLRWNRFRLVHR